MDRSLSLFILAMLLFSSFGFLCVNARFSRPERPHIVMFVIDDLGWTDVGYRPDSGVHTPVLDSLAQSGVLLDNYYLQPVCSPSRAALMQGRYPFKTGMQHYNTIMPTSHAAMPIDQPTLAELLQQANYSTSAVGKWHLGYYHWDNTPTGRGFTSHQGYFQGEIDYYTKKFQVPHKFLPVIDIIGLDWWTNRTAVKNQTGIYNKQLYDEFMERALDDYHPNKENPLFLYYAHQIVHVPLDSPPKKWYTNCTHINDTKRRTYCAMLAAADDSLRLLVEKLKSKGIWEDTLLVVTTDNGGMPNVPGAFPASAGVNYPLRGGKGTVFEGGVKGIGFVNGGDRVIPSASRGTQCNELLHVVDWLPTLVKMSQSVEPPFNSDGFDLWDVLFNGAPIERKSIPVNINYNISFPDGGHQVAIITADGWKLIDRHVEGAVLNYDGWFPPPPAQPIYAPSNPSGKYLFNLKKDPNEHHNLYDAMPDKVAELRNILQDTYMGEYHAPQPNEFHVEGIPWFWDGVWAPFASA